MNDEIAAFSCSTADDLQTGIDDFVNRLTDIKDECESSLENIPENLKEGSSGQLLQERIENLDNAISELESIDTDFDEPDEDDLRDELKDSVDADLLNEPEDENAYWDEDEERKKLVTDEAISELKEQKEQEFVDEKIEELQNIDIS